MLYAPVLFKLSSMHNQVAYEERNYYANLQVYSITGAGEKALLKAHGNSSNPKFPRVVMFEMFASNKTPNAEYLRFQRAILLKSITNSWKNS